MGIKTFHPGIGPPVNPMPMHIEKLKKIQPDKLPKKIALKLIFDSSMLGLLYFE
jgi:hypothetical protein